MDGTILSIVKIEIKTAFLCGHFHLPKIKLGRKIETSKTEISTDPLEKAFNYSSIA